MVDLRLHGADACNYEMAATEDDGTCFFPSAGLDCSGEPLPDFPTLATHSVARIWNEATLLSIRHDWARPRSRRNLWRTSALMYDAWARVRHHCWRAAVAFGQPTRKLRVLMRGCPN